MIRVPARFGGWRFGFRAGLLALAASVLGGCLMISPEFKRAHMAPLLAVSELSTGVIGHRLADGRWPETMAEVERGLAAAHVPPDLAREVTGLEVTERGEKTAVYVFHFGGAGTATIRVNLR